MMQTLQATLIATNLRIGIVVSRFNELVTERLLQGALQTLERHGGSLDDVTLVRVPGAFEIPLMAQKLARSKNVDAIVCLGAVIRGGTPHFEYVCSATTSGIAKITLDTNLPIAFGLLTTDTFEQALERAGGKAGNKGEEAMLSAIEMAQLIKI